MSTGNPDAIPARGSPSHPLPSLGVSMNGQTRALANELEALPRGTLAQNIYRMVYQQARLNSLGSRPRLDPTARTLTPSPFRPFGSSTPTSGPC